MKSENSTYQAVVATWSSKETTIDYGGASESEAELLASNLGINYEEAFNITTKTIDYQTLCKPYTMQFDLLWQMLVLGQDKNFVFELAELAYNSEIVITVYDNLNVNVNTKKWHYDKGHTASIQGQIELNGSSLGVGHSHDRGDYLYTEDGGTITKVVTTKTNTLTTVLTKADTWIAYYDINYNHKVDGPNSSGGDTTSIEGEIRIADSVPMTIDEEKSKCSEGKIEAVENKLLSDANAAIDKRNQEIYEFKLDEEQKQHFTSNDFDYSGVTIKKGTYAINVTKTDTTEVTDYKYIKGEQKVEIKDDKTKTVGNTGKNFITIFNNYKYRTAKGCILSATDWWFEAIEKNENTVDMIGTIKYLLYKATGSDYGVTEIDPSLFEPGKFTSISSGGLSGATIESITKTTISREDFIQAVQGYSAAISKGAGTADFRNNADVIYDTCVKNNINPVLCAAQAWQEQNWDDPNTSPYNYWGIAVYNGQNYGNSYSSVENAVKGYCYQIHSQATHESYINDSKRYATVDSRFKGDMSTLYDYFSAYAYIGDGHTLQEEAKYAGDYVEKWIQCARQIFGEGYL